MTLNVTTEIVAIRERVARIETTLQQIQLTLQATKRSVESPTPGGNVVIPVAVATALIQGIVAVVQHFI